MSRISHNQTLIRHVVRGTFDRNQRQRFRIEVIFNQLVFTNQWNGVSKMFLEKLNQIVAISYAIKSKEENWNFVRRERDFAVINQTYTTLGMKRVMVKDLS